MTSGGPRPPSSWARTGTSSATRCLDKDGNLTYNDEDAKNSIWPLRRRQGRNLGYYNFANSPSNTMPVRDLRLFGILGGHDLPDGKLVEDLTPDYLNYAMDGTAPGLRRGDRAQSPA